MIVSWTSLSFLTIAETQLYLLSIGFILLLKIILIISCSGYYSTILILFRYLSIFSKKVSLGNRVLKFFILINNKPELKYPLDLFSLIFFRWELEISLSFAAATV